MHATPPSDAPSLGRRSSTCTLPFAKASSKIEHSSPLLAGGDVMGAPVPRTAPLSSCAAGLPLSDKEDRGGPDGDAHWA
ncbi:hypothetical protein FA10DRAFT_269189 [Acaromyces ingoldii]|uniref:Uncharacterized protein n=1 Tax=Acaromyces ingoldii TaxID=215250 RepID=A0A316YER3_9BASI|nr:hypothetical protein FA10DRAFT_269189 [Acaromyces ingoldii]PWN87907.1 hypothetical protein FA10DRAFT_269189 [Acaromyces ingoldii]